MPFQESTTTVNTTAVALGSNGFTGRARIVVQNGGGGGNLYIGSAGVTTATGFALASNSSQEFPAPQGSPVYAVSNLAGAIARVVEVG